MDVAAQQIETLEYLASRRRSCRAFKPTPLARESIQRILGVAQKAASWCNSQPWQIIITSGDETARFREAMYNAARNGAPQRGDFPFPREYQGVYAERRRESGISALQCAEHFAGRQAGLRAPSSGEFQFLWSAPRRRCDDRRGFGRVRSRRLRRLRRQLPSGGRSLWRGGGAAGLPSFLFRRGPRTFRLSKRSKNPLWHLLRDRG